MCYNIKPTCIRVDHSGCHETDKTRFTKRFHVWQCGHKIMSTGSLIKVCGSGNVCPILIPTLVNWVSRFNINLIVLSNCMVGIVGQYVNEEP